MNFGNGSKEILRAQGSCAPTIELRELGFRV